MPKATNIPKELAEDIDVLPDNTVLISINEEHEPLYPLKLDRTNPNILTVKFSDITAKREWMGKTIYPINEATTLKILDFINIHKGKDFIIHCAAGVSRSSAIALYLHLFHDYELRENFWNVSHPNKYVLGHLIVTRYMK